MGNSRMRSQLSCSLAVLLVLAREVNAAPLPSAGAFTYSDQCISRGSGDLYGLRITLLRGLGGNIWAITYVEDEAPFLAFAKYDAKTGAVRIRRSKRRRTNVAYRRCGGYQRAARDKRWRPNNAACHQQQRNKNSLLWRKMMTVNHSSKLDCNNAGNSRLRRTVLNARGRNDRRTCPNENHSQERVGRRSTRPGRRQRISISVTSAADRG